MTGPTDNERMIWARQDLLQRHARKYFHRFGPAVVRDREEPVEFDVLQLAWIAHLDYCWSRGQHAGIFTTQRSGGFIALLASWLAGSIPGAHVKIVCANDAHGRARMRIVKGIATSIAYGKVFPEMATGEHRWNDHTMFLEHTGQAIEPMVEATGIAVKAAGGTISHLLFDSVVDADNNSSFERREAQKRMVDNLWIHRLEPGGKILWIATPVNPDDTSYAMRARPDFWWLEQRPRADGSGYEQEVYGAPEDYLDKTSQALLKMLDWK